MADPIPQQPGWVAALSLLPALLLAVTPFVAALVAGWISIRNHLIETHKKLSETAESLNGSLSEWKEETKQVAIAAAIAAHGQGFRMGQADERLARALMEGNQVDTEARKRLEAGEKGI